MWLADCELLMYLIDNKLVFKIPNSQALMNVFNNIKLKQILTEFFACFFMDLMCDSIVAERSTD